MLDNLQSFTFNGKLLDIYSLDLTNYLRRL